MVGEDGLLRAAQVAEGQTQAQVNLLHRRPKGKGPAVAGHGRLEIPLGPEGIAEVAMGFR